jgi:hypothetical protein
VDGIVEKMTPFFRTVRPSNVDEVMSAGGLMIASAAGMTSIAAFMFGQAGAVPGAVAGALLGLILSLRR